MDMAALGGFAFEMIALLLWELARCR